MYPADGPGSYKVCFLFLNFFYIATVEKKYEMARKVQESCVTIIDRKLSRAIMPTCINGHHLL